MHKFVGSVRHNPQAIFTEAEFDVACILYRNQQNVRPYLPVEEIRAAVRAEILRDAANPTLALRELDRWTDSDLTDHWNSVFDIGAIASMVEECQ